MFPLPELVFNKILELSFQNKNKLFNFLKAKGWTLCKWGQLQWSNQSNGCLRLQLGWSKMKSESRLLNKTKKSSPNDDLLNPEWWAPLLRYRHPWRRSGWCWSGSRRYHRLPLPSRSPPSGQLTSTQWRHSERWSHHCRIQPAWHICRNNVSQKNSAHSRHRQ